MDKVQKAALIILAIVIAAMSALQFKLAKSNN